MPCTRAPSLRTSGPVRSECAMPRPALIQFTAPGRIAWSDPSVSLCTISPSKRYVTVARPMWMRTHVEAVPGLEGRGPHVVPEDERPDEPPLHRRQGAAHGEAADVASASGDH